MRRTKKERRDKIQVIHQTQIGNMPWNQEVPVKKVTQSTSQQQNNQVNLNAQKLVDESQSESKKIIVEVKSLNKSFKNQLVLKDINLKIHQKSFHALIGENGAGKTTLIKSILGLYDNFSGEIRVNQIRNSEPESRKDIFYFDAHPKFPTFLNMEQYLKFTYNLYESKMSNVKNDLITYLKRFNLWKHRKKRIGNLSSGQKKKVLIIEALLFKAKFWILDEPTANLDPNTRREIYRIISEEIEANGTTVLISTHNLAEISPYATEATFIFDGKVFWNSLLNKTDNLEAHYFRLLNEQLNFKTAND